MNSLSQKKSTIIQRLGMYKTDIYLARRFFLFILKATGQAHEEVCLCQSLQQLCLLLRLNFFSLSWEESKGLDVCQEQWKRENGQGSEDRLQPCGMTEGVSGDSVQSCSDNLVQCVIWEHFENWQETVEKIKGEALKQTTILSLSYVYYTGILYIYSRRTLFFISWNYKPPQRVMLPFWKNEGDRMGHKHHQLLNICKYWRASHALFLLLLLLSFCNCVLAPQCFIKFNIHCAGCLKALIQQSGMVQSRTDSRSSIQQ